jgi:hypothetical protein
MTGVPDFVVFTFPFRNAPTIAQPSCFHRSINSTFFIGGLRPPSSPFGLRNAKSLQQAQEQGHGDAVPDL